MLFCKKFCIPYRLYVQVVNFKAKARIIPELLLL